MCLVSSQEFMEIFALSSTQADPVGLVLDNQMGAGKNRNHQRAFRRFCHLHVSSSE